VKDLSDPSLGVPSLKGWYRRFLPHRDEPGLIQFITYRLADSVPNYLLEQIQDELKKLPPERRNLERRRKIEVLLDKGHGSGILREAFAAACVMENWRHFAGRRYDLIAWVVMPTHVHIMIRPREGESLPRIVQSWKSYTGKRLKSLFPSACADGKFWAREYWDRYIRDEKHFRNALEYIQMNPVKAGLVLKSADWPFVGNNSGITPGNTEHQLGG
jgi:putative transposase